MLKLVVGFVCGLCVSAVAQDRQTLLQEFKEMNMKAVQWAGVGPDGNMAPIKVDAEGRVTCAPQ